MKVSYDYIRHNVDNEAPFTGAVIYAQRDGKPHKMEIGKLMRTILDQELNEGIIFKGDWTSQGLEFINILKYVKKYNLKVCIYTEHELEVFKMIIGITACEKQEKRKIPDEELQNQMSKFALMGGILIDYYLTEDYYVVCGKEGNQKVYKIKKVEDADEENNSEV